MSCPQPPSLQGHRRSPRLHPLPRVKTSKKMVELTPGQQAPAQEAEVEMLPRNSKAS